MRVDAADQQHVVDLGPELEAGVLDGLLDAARGSIVRSMRSAVSSLELGTGQLDSFEVQRALEASAVMNGRLIVGLLSTSAELDLGLLGGFLQTLQREPCDPAPRSTPWALFELR